MASLVYYTHFSPCEEIQVAVRNQILKCHDGEIISVTAQRSLDFGKNIVLNEKPGILTMFKQILAGVESATSDIIFLVEHDVLYHPDHFKFKPKQKDRFYYDENRWFVDYNDGKGLFYHAMSVSLLCAYKDLLVKHYKARVERVEKEGFTLKMGYEPGGHKPPRGVDSFTREAYWANTPSIDLRHTHNVTPSRWDKKHFRNQQNLWAWKMSETIPGWGNTHDIIERIKCQKSVL